MYVLLDRIVAVVVIGYYTIPFVHGVMTRDRPASRSHEDMVVWRICGSLSPTFTSTNHAVTVPSLKMTGHPVDLTQ